MTEVQIIIQYNHQYQLMKEIEAANFEPEFP